ncbi:MAG: hypothetical protein GXP50_14295 [Deltaproteobacteria bacterium]|nr:hypothetical protein [Deltaproteobacteria bacterium]
MIRGCMVWVVLAVAAAPAWGGINPANPGLPTASAYGTTYTGNAASAMCVDCHTANPKPNSGTHFVAHYDGSAVRTTGNLSYEKTDSWSGGAAYLSRYANPAPPDPTAQSVTGQTGEIICESCHNLVHNAAGGNNLLERFRENEDPSTLCEGCHTAQASGPPAHHPLTGDTVGPDDDDPANHTLNTGHASVVRSTPASGSEVTYPAANAVNCASCHRPHGAQVQTGARALKRGLSAVTTIPNVQGKPVNVIYYDNVPEPGDVQGNVKQWDTGDVVPGIDRQVDVETVLGAGKRLVSNPDPVCDACHVAND